MNFYAKHDFITLIFLTLFPRLTLLIGGFATGGIIWWLGFLFAPHLLVAILSLAYWQSNPVIVIMAWIVAFGGTKSEGKSITYVSKKTILATSTTGTWDKNLHDQN